MSVINMRGKPEYLEKKKNWQELIREVINSTHTGLHLSSGVEFESHKCIASAVSNMQAWSPGKKTGKMSFRQLQGAVALSTASANHWFRSIESFRFYGC